MKWLFAGIKKKIEECREIERKENIALRSIESAGFKLWIDEENRMRVYFNDNELTKYFGLCVDVLSEGTWYGSVGSGFQVTKLSAQALKITISLRGLPVQEIWEINISPDGIFNWDVSLNVEKPIRIDRIVAKLFLSKFYGRWITPLIEGDFPFDFSSQWQSIDFSRYKCNFIGAISSKQGFPGVTFQLVGEQEAMLSIQNSDLALSSRVLEAQLSGEELYQAGIYPLATCLFRFYHEEPVLLNILNEIREEENRLRKEEELKTQEEKLKRQEEEEKKRREEEERRRQEELLKLQEEAARLEAKHREDTLRRSLNKGPVRTFFDQHNRTHIYFKETELTKACGLEVRILSEGKWISSSGAKTVIEKSSSDETVIYFTHEQFPLTEIWHFKIKADGRIDFSLNLHLLEPLRIDLITVSLFLSKSYIKWILPHAYGDFPPHFSGDWQTAHQYQGQNEFIGVLPISVQYPGVLFKIIHGPIAFYSVRNSDRNLSSRVLEIQFEEGKEVYQAGAHQFLNGAFELYSDASVFEKIINIIKEEEAQKKREAEEARLKDEECRRKEAESRVICGIDEKVRDENDVYIYGDTEYLHDKICAKGGDFLTNIARLKSYHGGANIKIGVSRFNYFRINEIAQFCSSFTREYLDLRSVTLAYFPAKRLYANFIEYIRDLNARLVSSGISLFLEDEQLFDLLYTASSQADKYNERDLLRLLGIISEHPFIGPQTIVLDTFHRCNTNCVHCWIHNPRRDYPHELEDLKMGTDIYRQVIDDAASLFCDEIIIQGDGEPLLDKRLPDMVRYARENGLKVLFFTNAICLNKEKAREIIDLGVSEVFCSLPAGTDKTYAQINPKQNRETFSRIIANLSDLVLMRRALGINRPVLQMTHVIHNLNCHELEEMAKIDAQINADKVRFYLARLDKNIDHLKLSTADIEKIKNSLPGVAEYLNKRNIALQDNIYFQSDNYNPETGFWSKNKFIKSGCPVGWFFSLILAKGEVSMCCHLRITGSLQKNSFREIWNSEQYNEFRIRAKNLANTDTELYDEFCNHCDTHQVILRIDEMLRKYKLERFLTKKPNEDSPLKSTLE